MKSKLAVIREEKGLSQKILSEVMGVTQQTLSSWEVGRTLPKPHQMQHLEDFLGVKKEVIFSDAFKY